MVSKMNMLEINNLGGELKSDLYLLSDNNAVTRFVNSILNDMEPILTSRQLTELHTVLQQVITNYSISSDEKLYGDVDYRELNRMLIDQFLEDKKLAGLSDKSLCLYQHSLEYTVKVLYKGFDSIIHDYIFDFFNFLIEENKSSMVTVDNYRRILNSFYGYCVTNGLLYKNPILKINAIKRVKKIKQAYSYEEIIFLRENLNTLRDKAIFELLLSSGMRVGDLVKLNHKDLNMNECAVIVHGKGDKEREVFFNELAKVSINRYLESRVDTNPALFVSLHSPYHRLGISGVETMLRELGKRSGVNKVHPHRFRRHFATQMIRKGVHIEQVQQLLGHAEIETTQMYIVNDEDEIAYNHKRYVN